MTLDEAIKREQNMVYEYIYRAERHCVTQEMLADIDYHNQLVKWLEELRANKVTSTEIYKSGYKRGYKESYNKAIDGFADKIKEKAYKPYTDSDYLIINNYYLNEIAVQLKESGVNGMS